MRLFVHDFADAVKLMVVAFWAGNCQNLVRLVFVGVKFFGDFIGVFLGKFQNQRVVFVVELKVIVIEAVGDDGVEFPFAVGSVDSVGKFICAFAVDYAMLDIGRNLEVAVGIQFDIAIDFAALLRGGRGIDFVHVKSQSRVFFQRQIIAGGSRVVEVQRGVLSQINFTVAVAADTAANVEQTVFGHVDGAGVINIVGGFDAVHNFVIVFENSFAAKADGAGVPNRAAVGLFARPAHIVAAKGRRLDIVNIHLS